MRRHPLPQHGHQHCGRRVHHDHRLHRRHRGHPPGRRGGGPPALQEGGEAVPRQVALPQVPLPRPHQGHLAVRGRQGAALRVPLLGAEHPAASARPPSSSRHLLGPLRHQAGGGPGGALHGVRAPPARQGGVHAGEAAAAAAAAGGAAVLRAQREAQRHQQPHELSVPRQPKALSKGGSVPAAGGPVPAALRPQHHPRKQGRRPAAAAELREARALLHHAGQAGPEEAQAELAHFRTVSGASFGDAAYVTMGFLVNAMRETWQDC